MKGLGASNEAIFQTSFRVLMFSREFLETMKFNYSSNKMMLLKLYTDVAAVVLLNLDMKKQL